MEENFVECTVLHEKVVKKMKQHNRIILSSCRRTSIRRKKYS